MKMGGSKGGFIPLLQAQRASKLLFSWTVCYACLGKLHRLHDGDFGKNTILEKHKIDNRRASSGCLIFSISPTYSPSRYLQRVASTRQPGL